MDVNASFSPLLTPASTTELYSSVTMSGTAPKFYRGVVTLRRDLTFLGSLLAKDSGSDGHDPVSIVNKSKSGQGEHLQHRTDDRRSACMAVEHNPGYRPIRHPRFSVVVATGSSQAIPMRCSPDLWSDGSMTTELF